MASPRPEPCRTRRRAAAVPGRLVALVLVAAAVAGCVYTKAVPVGRDTWRLETDGRGALGAEVASRRVLKDAAALTLRQGFTHFLLDDAPAGPSSLAVPALLYGDTRIVAFGSPVGAGAGRAAGPADVRTAVTVIMLRKGDPRIPTAYDALAVLGS